MEELLQKHGPLPESTPVSQTATGGRHYLFSLSGSLAAGLESARNATKLHIDGQEATWDVRGDGGCLLVYPSHYVIDGASRQYAWLQPLGDKHELPPMPAWLIAILNRSGVRGRGSEASALQVGGARKKSALMVRSEDSTLYDMVKERVHELVPFDKVWVRENGFDFRPEQRTDCVCCPSTHTSNNYRVRRILSTCFKLINYSKVCRPRIYDNASVKVLEDVFYSPKTDDPYVKVLQVVTAEDGQRLVYTGKQWMCYMAPIWEGLSDLEIKQRINVQVNQQVVEQLAKYLPSDGDTAKYKKGFRVANEYLKKAHNVSSVAEKAKQLLLDTTLMAEMDTNKDIVACKSGVIDLKTGKLRPAQSYDFLSRAIDAEYTDASYATPDIDAFF